MKKINVFIVDDSALMRQLLSEILRQDPEIGLVETANDPVFALPKMEKSWPDVIVMDIEMPRMSGIEFSAQIMRERPTPIVIVSSKTEKNLALGLEALRIGAVELFHKPEIGLQDFLKFSAPLLLQTIKDAAQSKVATGKAKKNPVGDKPVITGGKIHRSQQPSFPRQLIVMGASTGGTVALEKILQAIDFPHCPIVIVQHMPSGFTKAFAQRLNSICRSEISEAADGQILRENSVYVAPGGLQTDLIGLGAEYRLRVMDTAPVNRHKPSVDVLFNSAVNLQARRLLAILLTGMGADGARGMEAIFKHGGETIAQDAESCVVFGMPAEAIKLGVAKLVRPLDSISNDIRDFCS